MSEQSQREKKVEVPATESVLVERVNFLTEKIQDLEKRHKTLFASFVAWAGALEEKGVITDEDIEGVFKRNAKIGELVLGWKRSGIPVEEAIKRAEEMNIKPEWVTTLYENKEII